MPTRPLTAHGARRAARVGVAAFTVAAVALTSSCGGNDRGTGTGGSPTSTTAAASNPAATVTTPSTTSPGGASLAVTGPISSPTQIGPAAGSELDLIDRDAGVSVRLRDGSTLWLFGDTARADEQGALVYFQIGTAAWAAAGEPAVTRDVAVNGEPVAFATPTAEFPPCPAIAPTAGMWPSSAVVQPVGDRDRVIVWMENICLGSSIRGAARGMSVAEWYYDPAVPPTSEPIRARILNQTLFPQRSYGLASIIDEDGSAIVYSCGSPEQGGPPEQYGPCSAAKVALDQVANPMAYRAWNGRDWGGPPESAVPLAMAPSTAPYPAGSFSLTRDPGLGRFVMVYSPWPGYSDSLVIRTSASPTGPWGPPTLVPLPGCSDAEGATTFWCYAASAQPIFSSPGRLGVGWYDRRVSSNPVRGSYLVATVPYDAAG